jgi:hypothetical protein
MDWAQHSAITPTPVLRASGEIRVYAGLRDRDGVSRIGWVDVAPDDPTRVLRISSKPALDIGTPGCFDDNGVILGDVVDDAGSLTLIYVGFQLVEKVKFLAFTGLARSQDHGDTFQRITQAPILDRADEGLCFRAIHSAIREGNRWRAWYGVGSEWRLLEGLPYPSYHIRHVEGADLSSLPDNGAECISSNSIEYRIGRPRVYRMQDRYVMYYTAGTTHGSYLAGLAESADGVHWERMDHKVGIGPSAEGWDSTALCYPALLEVAGRTYMFYNGNDMGKTGFGVAVLESA